MFPCGAVSTMKVLNGEKGGGDSGGTVVLEGRWFYEWERSKMNVKLMICGYGWAWCLPRPLAFARFYFCFTQVGKERKIKKIVMAVTIVRERHRDGIRSEGLNVSLAWTGNSKRK
ncbi:hypothetical protein DEO72_LG6g1104 [Vigna unguiculata]|uniref:Uncharacterized protein n=1 Tax=Vigna unguiculata TaxID=3917 RepID=A0A4D6M538_VIGUN|nr:hypothetical protein DEO72_LG6g1104 [Vigna unguiculata]